MTIGTTPLKHSVHVETVQRQGSNVISLVLMSIG